MASPKQIIWGDTLIAHHAYASHLLQRLDHVVSEYCDSAPWKLAHRQQDGFEANPKALPKDMGPQELCLYNSIDARLTAVIWQRMQADLAPEMHVYRHDMQLAEVCRQMAWDGIVIDVERKEFLSNLCAKRRAALKGIMRRIIHEPTFMPGKLDEVRRVLFRKLRGTYTALTAGGQPSTANATLEALRMADTRLGRFADALLKWRLVGKIKSTYLDALVVNEKTGRHHPVWKVHGTVSGRLASRIMSCPRWDGRDVAARVREIYTVPEGHEWVYFDVSQAEMRLAAYLSADPAFMAACGKDVHEGNARTVFPEIAARGWFDGKNLKDPAMGKPYRDISKNLGFAIAYGAEVERVYITLRAKGFPITYRAVEQILARLHSVYHVYYKYVERNLAAVRKCGYMRTPILGRIRWFGWYPKPTEISNFPVQSALADIMNARMIRLAKMMPKGVKLSMQIHDACAYETPKHLVAHVRQMIQSVWDEPVRLAGGDLVLPIDLKVGTRWSEL